MNDEQILNAPLKMKTGLNPLIALRKDGVVDVTTITSIEDAMKILDSRKDMSDLIRIRELISILEEGAVVHLLSQVELLDLLIASTSTHYSWIIASNAGMPESVTKAVIHECNRLKVPVVTDNFETLFRVI